MHAFVTLWAHRIDMMITASTLDKSYVILNSKNWNSQLHGFHFLWLNLAFRMYLYFAKSHFLVGKSVYTLCTPPLRRSIHTLVVTLTYRQNHVQSSLALRLFSTTKTLKFSINGGNGKLGYLVVWFCLFRQDWTNKLT